MTKYLGALTMMLSIASATLPAQTSSASANADAIRKVIANYNQALNAGDVERIVKLFEPDGVWMPPGQPTVMGEQALREWYKNSFSKQVLDLTFTPVEVIIDTRWGFSRVNIVGDTKPKDGRRNSKQDAKTIFVLHQGTDNVWRIARYIYTTNLGAAPPPAATAAK